MEVVVVTRKLMIMYVGRCWRSVCEHPFLAGFLFFLFLLYRSFPLMFSLLVSVSPILICTAILLGTLLSFGEPQYPEIDKEEQALEEEMSPLKTGLFGNHSGAVSRDVSSMEERFMGDKKDMIQKALERVIVANAAAGMLQKEDGLLGTTPLNHDHFSLKAQGRSEKRAFDQAYMVDEKERDRVIDGSEVEEYRYSLIEEDGEDDRADDNRDPCDTYAESTVSSKYAGGYKEDKREEEDEDSSLDSESDNRAESSSLDLNEFHPLLRGEEDQQALLSLPGSDVVSEHSRESDDGNAASDDDSENMDGEDGDDENDEEESTAAGKEDASKSAITWTEADQKNLMEVGTSELERNQRLEILIARRSARRMVAEKNLIDFEGSDLPFNVLSIATTRTNAGPDDTYNGMGLPPIPGSAPSILLPRRNPFYLPFEPNKEKPDLNEDSFQQEVVSAQPAQPPHHNQQIGNFFFRRYESFTAGPSRRDVKWKPFLAPEHFPSEGTSFRSFERQSGGMSDSKASSAPDTESVTSTVEVDNEEKTGNELEELLDETEEMLNMDRASLLVERGSTTSDDIDLREIDEEQGEKRNTLHEEETKEVEEENKEVNSRRSDSRSPSSFSEVDEKIDEEKKDGKGALSSTIEYPNEELRPHIDVEFSFVTDHHEEPVFDSSPKYLSFSSDSSDPSTDGDSAEQRGTSNAKDVNEEVSNVPSSPSSGVESIGNDSGADSYVHHEHDHIEPQPSDMSSVMTEVANGENREEALYYGGRESVAISTLTSQCPSYCSSSNYDSPTAGPGSGDQTPGRDDFRILRRQATEYYDLPSDVYGALSLDEALEEGGNEEIKEIDERFLVELDAVGDFRLEENGNRSRIPEIVKGDDIRFVNRDSSNLPVLEVRSVEDVDLAFKQLDEGAGIDEVAPPTTIKDQQQSENSEETTSMASSSEPKDAEALTSKSSDSSKAKARHHHLESGSES